MFLIYLILTERCNYHCDFCIRENIGHGINEFSLEMLSSTINSLSETFPNSALLLTGGEPTLHPFFKDIVKLAVSKFYAVQITSNGAFKTDLNDYLHPLLKKNLYLQMSLDGTPDFHNKIRGEHAFEAVIDNLEKLKDVSSHVSLSATISHNNFEEAKKLALILNSYSFSHFKVSPVIEKDASNITSTYAYEWNNFVDELLPLCFYEVDVKKLYDFELMSEYVCSGISTEIVTNCGLGYSKIYVRPNLNILTCSCTNNVIGNLRNDSLETICDRLTHIQKIDLDINSICYNCEFKSICNGGCPGYSQKIFGVNNFGDVRCPRVYKFAKENGFLK